MSDNYWTRKQRRAPLSATPISRRRLLAGLSATAGTAFLIACGGGDDKPSDSGSVATQAPASGGSAAAGAQPANVPKGGGISGSILASDAKSFHIGQTTDAPSATYQRFVYGGGALTDYNPETIELVPHAAEKWTISDDKKTYTFTLKDVKWSDGAPLTTADYVWTYEQLKKPENKYPYITNIDAIDSYIAVDPKTLRVSLKEALAVGLENSDVVTPLPKHVWEKYDWADSTKNPEILNPTVVNGAWKVKEWKKDNYITFAANESYFLGRPNLDTVTFRTIGTGALIMQSLKAGEIDFTQEGDIQPGDYKEAKGLPNVTMYDWWSARGTWNYIGFNLRRPALKDINVRRAIAYATDRKGIIDSLAFGLGRPTYSNYAQASWVYNPNVEKYDYDPKKAADLLKQAGWTLGSNKKLTKDGQTLNIKMLYNTGNTVREGVATVMQQQLTELGFNVEVQGMEFQAYLEYTRSEPFDYDLYVLGWNSTIEPHFANQIWNEKAIPALNRGGYINKEVERLYVEGSKEFDREKRKQIYGQIQKILADELPYVFLYENQRYIGANKKIGGIKATRRGVDYASMKDWYLVR